ncbi:MAG: alpha/beta fold hydrolase, partial [Saprospiraceae bacterium]|nr:alpha/beta fold hydrolase [Saprospiraceae bacterium]
LGTDLRMWDAVVPLLLPYFRIIRYDTRGLGQSEVTPNPYSIAQLGQDLINLLDELHLEKVYFCGSSMGGQIGQWLGINHSRRLHKLVLSNTAAQIGSTEKWNDRVQLINEEGLQAIWSHKKNIWLRDQFVQNNPGLVAALEEMFLQNDVLGYANCCCALRDADFRQDLRGIDIETLVITGDDDPATTLADAEVLVSNISNAVLATLPARHIPSIEQPKAFANVLIEFLVGKSHLEKGVHIRRTVLGDTHVNQANLNRTKFTADFQDFISRYAWGEIWTRPSLGKHNRSLIALAMMIALNRKAEFKMHIKAALNNGVSVEEIKEVILQAGVYCGLPAANDAFQSATEVFEEMSIDYS